ncbi:glycosyltransferase family 2 protein [Rhodovulum euryhalinum]|uniref:Cellulose synthase (UDP-forming) n=1 Tax=Rhodovulum euryhalinum TaxID=35805 RepID=A0A4R2KQX2_9RHOB|nr:glycosyltransferase family 2 protein [Rhodovulum euryhalinum]TCO73339.1 cellulose synthase (UDP-forming) [Rhodovulum euryhalinum]
MTRLPDGYRARGRPRHLVSVYSPGMKMRYRLSVLLWVATVVWFWAWWFQPHHNIGTLRYLVVTLAVAWIMFLQAYFLTVMLRACRPSGDLSRMQGARVAMVVTKSPSEPFEVVRRTLEGMLAQDWPHDTWLADENPAPETLAWCAAHGVKVSTRKDRPDYHRAEWPRRTRCKEGNLAFFYDHFGYDGYDFVSQLDADHVPQPGYLREVLRGFVDPEVGYVSAPSICASNARDSWAARMRLDHEGMFHGILQAGYSNGWAPMCIGSHYAVRTTALREIGGLGPELAEDHSTSMMMNAHGWRGVHAFDAIAIGDGPVTFADMLTQEFQWSRSLVTLFLRYTPRYFAGLRPILKFQFLFSQLWYPTFALFMAATMLVPVTAVLFDIRYADVTYPAFVGHSLPVMLAFILIAYQLRADGLFRPIDARVISWEKGLFQCAQWPWVLWGCVMAVRDSLTGRFVDFRITPKGASAEARLPFRVLVPYVVLALMAILPVILVEDAGNAAGFYLLCLFNAFLYLIVLAVAIVHHMRQNMPDWPGLLFRYGPQVAVVVSLLGLMAFSGWLRGMQSLHYLSTGLGPYQFTKLEFLVSGAGQGGRKSMHYSFDLPFGRQER